VRLYRNRNAEMRISTVLASSPGAGIAHNVPVALDPVVPASDGSTRQTAGRRRDSRGWRWRVVTPLKLVQHALAKWGHPRKIAGLKPVSRYRSLMKPDVRRFLLFRRFSNSLRLFRIGALDIVLIRRRTVRSVEPRPRAARLQRSARRL
jgi:hypothetical protein